MTRAWIVRPLLIALLLPTLGCASRITPPPASVTRVAVLPPVDANGTPLPGPAETSPTYAERSLADVLVQAAREELARHGFGVVDANRVRDAIGGRVPSTPEAAADIVAAARLEAIPLFIRVRQWEYDRPAMRTDRIIAAVDLTLIQPGTGRILWQVRRSPKPIPLHGALFQGQADVVAANELMREMLADIGAGGPKT